MLPKFAPRSAQQNQQVAEPRRNGVDFRHGLLTRLATPMDRSLFITGAGGYLGARVLARIEPARWHRILCLLRQPPSFPPPAPNVEFILGDLLESPTFGERLRSCHTVLHMAAVTGKNTSDAYFRTNTEGTRRLVQAARAAGVRNFLHISTIAVKFRDQSRYYYAQSKKLAEEIVRSSGLRYTILRPTIITGPNAPVLQSLSRLARAPVIPIVGDGRTLVQPVFVDDLADCILSLLDEDPSFQNQTTDFGGPQTLTIEQLLLRLGQRPGARPPRVVHLPPRVIIPVVALLERCFARLPVSAGQFASFTNDGTAGPSPVFEQRRPAMRTTEDVLRLIAAESLPASNAPPPITSDAQTTAPSPPSLAAAELRLASKPLSQVLPGPPPAGAPESSLAPPTVLAVEPPAPRTAASPGQLETECLTYTRYLIGQQASPYVLAKYRQAHQAIPALAAPPADPFDDFLVRFSARAPLAAALADAFCCRFFKRATVRKKLVLALALLECAPGSASAIDSPGSGGRTAALLRLAAGISSAAALLLVSALVLGPIRLLFRCLLLVEKRETEWIRS